ncbi:MAG: DUF4235 domain-containing protein [Propioniciclava sp.]|uniref:DUF4235 domain-containing protein n=1 Tax=Propioniciclava sp. TaxID=2038686 RepID=UPI0039E42329
MDFSHKIVWQLYSAGVAAAAALVTTKAVSAGWSFVTGEEPPEPNDPHVPTGKAAAWVMALAVGVGLSQVLANRMVANRWESFTGAPSPLRSVNLRL